MKQRFSKRTTGTAVENIRNDLDHKIRKSRELLAKKKTLMSVSDHKAAQKVQAAQKRLFESVTGAKW